MKILYLAHTPKKIYRSIVTPLVDELSKDKRVTTIRNQLPTERQIDNCDVVYVHSTYIHIFPDSTIYKNIKKPKIAFIEDIHLPSRTAKKPKNRVSYVIHKNFDCLFVRYKREFEVSSWAKTWDRPWFWLPHCIDPVLFKDWKLKKDIDILSVGRYAKQSKYFIRHLFYHTFKSDKGFYRLEMKENKFGEDFSKIINRAKITGTSNKGIRTFAKSFEIPSSMSCLACNTSHTMPELGFKPDVNYIKINPDNIREKIDYYLKNDEERMKITLNGYKLIHERHTVKIRAKQWFENIEKFMRGTK